MRMKAFNLNSKKKKKMAQLRPPGNVNLDGKVAQSDTDELRVCAVYPCALTPGAEYLALTLCKPSGGVVKYTTPTPPPLPPPHRSRPVDLRHWTSPRSLSGVGKARGDGIGPESRHFNRGRMGCPRRRCSARMLLQGAETLNRTPEDLRGGDDHNDDDDVDGDGDEAAC